MQQIAKVFSINLLIVCAGLIASFTTANAQQKLQVSGYGTLHFMDQAGNPRFVDSPDLDKSFFQFRELAIFFDLGITDAIVISTEFEVGNNAHTYLTNYAYIDVELSESFSFRAGKILVPFLYYNENKPNFKQFLMSQPFTAWNVVPVIGIPVDFHGFGWGDAGVTLNWLQAFEETGVLSVKFSLINGIGSDSNVLDDNVVMLDAGTVKPVIRTRDGLIQNRESTKLLDNNDNKAIVIKASFRALEFPLEFGISGYQGAWDAGDKKDLKMYGLHLNWLANNVTFKSEYVMANVEQDAGIDLVANAGMTGPALINTSSGDYSMEAFYLEGSVIPFRWSEDRFLRFVARYDEVDTNNKVVFTPFNRSRITLGVEWQFARNTRFRYEFQRSKINDFDKAPIPFKSAGGKEFITIHMPSIIVSF
jgi:hypothetical protein